MIQRKTGKKGFIFFLFIGVAFLIIGIVQIAISWKTPTTPPQRQHGFVKFCHSCGSALDHFVEYCPKCGQRVMRKA